MFVNFLLTYFSFPSLLPPPPHGRTPQGSIVLCVLWLEVRTTLPSHRLCPTCAHTTGQAYRPIWDAPSSLGPAHGGRKQNTSSRESSRSLSRDSRPCLFCTQPFSPGHHFHRFCPVCAELRAQRQSSAPHPSPGSKWTKGSLESESKSRRQRKRMVVYHRHGDPRTRNGKNPLEVIQTQRR